MPTESTEYGWTRDDGVEERGKLVAAVSEGRRSAGVPRPVIKLQCNTTCDTSGLEVETKIGSQSVMAYMVVDCGAMVTVLSKRIFDLLPFDDQHKLKPCPFDVSQADGKHIEISGQVELPFEIGGRVVEQTMVVANLANDGLLGMDFFRKYNGVIDVGRNSLLLNGMEVPIYPSQQKPSCCSII